jgi:hypothetical protein
MQLNWMDYFHIRLLIDIYRIFDIYALLFSLYTLIHTSFPCLYMCPTLYSYRHDTSSDASYGVV